MSDGIEYHLPHGSWAPLWVALGMSLLAVGLVLPTWALGIGIATFALAGLYWLREDREWWDEMVGTGHEPGRWGILLFIGSEVMIFGALFATYFSFRSSPAWPAETPHLPIATTGLFTIILLASGATMHWAHSALRMGDKKWFKGHLVLTLLLGAIFMGGQAMEYMTLIHEGVTITSHPFGTTFYLLTGTHGLHVIGGLVALGIVAYRTFVHDQFDAQRHVMLEAAAIYWHFVDLVWVFVYAILYLGWI
jgi:cytochrome c oxidase subunit 3